VWTMAVLLVAACSGGSEDRSTFSNEGKVCLRLLSDGTLEVRVQFPTCLSSSCSRVVETGCRVTVSESTLGVTSHGTVEGTGASACTDDCGALVAECEATEPLEPGEYTVRHGGDSTVVTPGDIETCVFDDGRL